MNNVQLVGRLAKEPQKFNSIVVITVAIDRPTTEKATDFPQVKVFGKQADNVMKYLKKGSMVAVDGSIETGKYDKNGETVYYTDVIAHRVEFISSNAKHAENSNKESVKYDEDDGFEELDDYEPF